jgi:hypothetical protein
METSATSSTGVTCASDNDCEAGQVCAGVDSGLGGSVCMAHDGIEASASPSYAGDGGAAVDAVANVESACDPSDASLWVALGDGGPEACPCDVPGEGGADGSVPVSDANPDDGGPEAGPRETGDAQPVTDFDGSPPDSAGPCGVPLRVCPDGGCAREVVLFGGIDSAGQYLSDTWVWDGGQWSEQTVDSGPSPRTNAGAATDCGGVLLYGGAVPPPVDFSSEQWVWVNDAWYQLPTVDAGASPGARGMFAFAKVNARQAVLFGGTSDIGVAMQDTLIWDDSSWTRPLLVTDSPPGRYYSGFGVLGETFVVFGGYADPASGNQSLLDDTWLWDGSQWALQSPSTSPPHRDAPAVASLTVNQTQMLILFGGVGGTAPLLEALSDTWVWDGSTWTQQYPVHVPPARSLASAATFGDRVVMFGGYDSSGITPLDDTWIWDGSDWTQETAMGPPARARASMAAMPP